MINRTIYKILKKRSMPDFMIVGAQKSGTTSLFSFLDKHSLLIGSQPKELHYFDKKKEKRQPIESYESNFMRYRVGENKLFFEATPNYLYHSHIPYELFKLKPNMKFIIVLRNPVERAFSAWNMYKQIFEVNKNRFTKDDHGIFECLYENRIEFPTFEECIDIEMELIKNKSEFIEPAILRRGLYYDQISNYLKYFPLENFFIIESEIMKKNHEEALEEIFKFLGMKKETIIQENEHVRKYDDQLKMETRTKLNSFYKQSNEKLYNLLKINYQWE